LHAQRLEDILRLLQRLAGQVWHDRPVVRSWRAGWNDRLTR
jgi:hypothetical protein